MDARGTHQIMLLLASWLSSVSRFSHSVPITLSYLLGYCAQVPNCQRRQRQHQQNGQHVGRGTPTLRKMSRMTMMASCTT